MGWSSRPHGVVELPLAGESPLQGALAGHGNLTGLSVLVAVEDASHGRLLGELLRRWQLIPQVVPGPAAALALIASQQESGNPIELAILEVNLNETSGWEMAYRLHADPRWASMPLILLTSMSESGIASVPSLEPCAWLLKPVSSSVLLETIQSLRKDGAKRPIPTPRAGTGVPTRKSLEVRGISESPLEQEVMDPELLLSQLCGDAKLMKEVVDLFLAERPALWAAIEEGMRRGDARGVTRAAHKVKGVLLNLTASPAAAAARKLEELCREERLAEAGAPLVRLRLELVRLQAVLEKLSATV